MASNGYFFSSRVHETIKLPYIWTQIVSSPKHGKNKTTA